MTSTQATPPVQQPRGAGSGAKATATRSRNIVDWPPEPKSHEEHVDELEQEAQAQADHNAEVNAIQTKLVAAFKDKISFPQGDPADPDEQRKTAREAFLDVNDPEKKKAALKGEMEARAKRDRAQSAATTTGR
jgi:hypothetical protein